MRDLGHHGLYIFVAYVLVNAVAHIFKNWLSFAETAASLSTLVAGHPKTTEGIGIFSAVLMINAIRRLGRTRERSDMARAAGLFFYRSNHKPSEKSKGTKFLRKCAAANKIIQIRASTGWETFGKADSPLHEVLKGCTEVNVLLLSPTGKDFVARAGSVGLNIREYRENLVGSILYLKRLQEGTARRPGTRVILKFYHNYPLWKFILLHDFVWVQYYPDKGHVQDMPCFAFAKDRAARGSLITETDLDPSDVAGEYNLFIPFCLQFEAAWRSHKYGQFDFETALLRFPAVGGQAGRTEVMFDEQTMKSIIGVVPEASQSSLELPAVPNPPSGDQRPIAPTAP